MAAELDPFGNELRAYIARHYGDDVPIEALSVARSGSPIPWNLGEYFEHFSPSSLSMTRRCPEQTRWRYVLGRKEKPAEAPVIGTAVHAALERNWGQKIESHEDLPTPELLDWYHDVGFQTVVQIEEAKAETEVLWDTSPDTAKTRGRVMLGEYHNAISPRIQPTATEGSFAVDLGAPVPIVGRFDVEQARSIIDVKTGKRKRTKPQESWKIQGAIYNHARGRPVEFHSLTATANNAVSIVTPLESDELLVSLTPEQRVLVAESVRAIVAELCLYMEMYGPDRPWPTHGTTSEWACNYCGFRPWCVAWEHER